MSDKKYLGESLLGNTSFKKINLVVKDNSITNNKLADGSVTMNKLGDDLASIASLSAFHASQFKVVDSVDKLPKTANNYGWIIDNHLYLYTGTGDALYTDCGAIRGAQGIQGEKGESGVNGQSAYEIWESENTGKTLDDFLAYMKGTKGEKGDKGDKGDTGAKGESITFDDLTQEEKDSLKGEKGADGKAGTNGVSITSVEQTVFSDKDGGTNKFKVTLSNGETSIFEIKNGSKGSTGEKGDKGERGEQGIAGKNGTNGTNGQDGAAGKNGKDGEKGAKGDKGDKGEKGDQGPQGLVGPQGPSGVSDVSNKTLINDTTTGGATNFLSAEVGKLGIMTYDCSKGGSVTFATIQDAIYSVPQSYQKGGMTIGVVLRGTGSYLNYYLPSRDWSDDADDWAIGSLGIAQEEGEGINVAISQKVFTEKINEKVSTSSIEDTLSEEEGKIPSSAAVNAALSTRDTTIESLSTKVSNILGGDDVSTTDANLKTLSTKVNSLVSTVGDASTSGSLVKDVADAKTNIRTNTSDITRLTSNLSTYNQSMQSYINSLNSSMSSLQTNMDTIQEDMKSVPKVVCLTEAEYEALELKDTDTYYMTTEE